MRIYAPEGIRAIGSQLLHGSVTIGSVTDLATSAIRVNVPNLQNLISTQVAAGLNLASLPSSIRGAIQNQVNSLTQTLTSRLSSLTISGGLAAVEGRVAAEITSQLGSIERTLRQGLPSALANTAISAINSQISSLSSNLASSIARQITPNLPIAGFDNAIQSVLQNSLMSGASALSALGASALGGISDLANHQIHLGQGMMSLGLGSARQIVMGGGHINLASPVGNISFGGGALQLASPLGNLNLGLGQLNLGSVSLIPTGINIGGLSLSASGISLGSFSLSTGGISFGSINIGSSMMTIGGANVATIADLPTVPTTVNNALYLNGQPDTYYTNIPARLGYTPANKAGDTFTGNVGIGVTPSVNFEIGGSSTNTIRLTSNADSAYNTQFYNQHVSANAFGITHNGNPILTSSQDAYGSIRLGTVTNFANVSPASGMVTLGAVTSLQFTSPIAAFTANVGIGNTAPLLKLHVEVPSGPGILNRTTSGIADFIFGNADGASNAKYSYIGGASGGYITFGKVADDLTTKTEYMRIDGAAGKVGIGVTAPQTKLHIDSGHTDPSATAYTGGLWIGDTGIYTASGLEIGSAHTAPYGMWMQTKVANSSAGNYPLVLQPLSGNVGIGTTGPVNLLDVNGNLGIKTGNNLRLYDSANSAFASLAFGSNTAGYVNLNYALELNQGGNALYLNGATQNYIRFALVGVNAPYANSTVSPGTKVLYYGTGGGDYAAGIDAATLWHSVPTTARFAWYGGTTTIAHLDTGNNTFSVANIVATNVTTTNFYATTLSANAYTANTITANVINTAYLNANQYVNVQPASGTSGFVYVQTTGAAGSHLVLNRPAGQTGSVLYQTAGNPRWQLQATGDAESGSNAGSNFALSRYSDAGSFIDSPLSINRDNGVTTFANSIQLIAAKSITTSVTDTFSYDSDTVTHYGLGWFNDSVDGWNAGGSTGYLSGYSGLKFFTTGTPRMSIAPGGDVGIGVTNAIATYGRTVHIGSSGGASVRFSGTTVNGFIGTHDSSSAMLLGTLSNHDITFSTNSTERARLYANGIINFAGKVSLGNTTPLHTFHVSGNTVGFVSTHTANSTAANGAHLYLGDAPFNSASYYNSSPGIGSVYSPTTTVAGDLGLYVYDGNVNSRLEVMRLLNNGNVGIGNTAPTHKLAVNGTAQITGVTNILGGSSLGLTIRSNTISTEEYNGVDAINLNYNGYLNGTTQFRNTGIYDGKQNAIAFFQGSNGYTGFGTSLPQEKVQIFKDCAPSEGNFALSILSANYQTELAFGAADAGAYSFIQSFQDATSWTNRPLILQPNGGSVGIGTITALNLEKLTVLNTSDYAIRAAGGSNRAVLLGGGTTFGIVQGSDNTGGVANLALQPVAGNVGIGNTTPSSKLVVQGGGATTIDLDVTGRIRTGDGSNLGGIWFGTGQFVGQHSASDAGVYVASQWRALFAANGNVGIGTVTPAYTLEVNGSFAATTKSFVIEHPTEEGMKLRHGSLEGPENGVYVRGKLQGTNIIELPDYWVGLVHEDSITVNLTPIGQPQSLYVDRIVNNKVYVGGDFTACFFTVFGERKDVERFEVEYND